MSHTRSFIATTVMAAATASIAAAGSMALSLPVWAMFIGWIAFYTRGLNTRSAFENLGCVGLGMAFGLVAAQGIGQLAPTVGPMMALPAVVFMVALLVVALRGLPAMNNLLGYFLGLVAWFAAHLDPSLENLVELFGASMIGSAAGWISHMAPQRLARQA
jgi:Na+/phosphate symporter